VATEAPIWNTTFQKELNFDPGAENLYSNTGYTLLAVIVERVQAGLGMCALTSNQK
jgi:CubicO group peptidase (beta-lactamase class C family)